MVLLLKPQAQFPVPHNHSLIALLKQYSVMSQILRLKDAIFTNIAGFWLDPDVNVLQSFLLSLHYERTLASFCTTSLPVNATVVCLLWYQYILVVFCLYLSKKQPLKCGTFVVSRTFVVPSSSPQGDLVHENLILLSWLVCHRKI